MDEEARKLLEGFSAGPPLLNCLQKLDENVAASVFPPLVGLLREIRSGKAPAAVTEAEDPLDGALTVSRGTSILTPRGKMDVGFCSDHIGIKGPKDGFRIPYSAIVSISLLDNMPQDPKKRVIILISLSKEAAVTYGKSTYRNIVIQTLSAEQVSLPDPKAPGSNLSGPQATVFATIFGKMGVPADRFRTANPNIFSSPGGFSAITAFIKISEGKLFPLEDAICYIGKEPLFVPLEEIECVELCRAGGSASTFDVNIYLCSKDIIEFGQIDKSCLGPLQSYLEGRSLRIGAPADSSGDDESSDGEKGASGRGASKAAVEEEEEDEDDESDEDFDPEADNDDSDDGEAGGDDGGEGGDDDDDDGEGGDDDDDDDDDDEFEVFSDDEISASQIRASMQAEKSSAGPSKKKRKVSS